MKKYERLKTESVNCCWIPAEIFRFLSNCLESKKKQLDFGSTGLPASLARIWYAGFLQKISNSDQTGWNSVVLAEFWHVLPNSNDTG
jgi:hypothetical protein